MIEDRTKKAYQGQSGREYHEGKRSVPPEALPWIARLRARKFSPHIEPHEVVLEYGVGYGWNLAELQCRRRLGYDVAEFLFPKLDELGIEPVTDLSRVEPDSIDVVICHHTLEHTLYPPQVLGEIRRLLRLGGKLLLCVPYEKERKFRRYHPLELNRHLYSWNVQTLARLVEEANFQVMEGCIGRFGQERFAALWASRLHLGEPGFRALRWLANSAKREQEVRVVAAKV